MIHHWSLVSFAEIQIPHPLRISQAQSLGGQNVAADCDGRGETPEEHMHNGSPGGVRQVCAGAIPLTTGAGQAPPALPHDGPSELMNLRGVNAVDSRDLWSVKEA